MAKNANLHAAKKAKNDEFYTRYEDIQAELIHYQKHFKGKVVYCNCDDPAESNFVKFFCDVFEDWGLKELIATHYDPDEEVFTYHISITEDRNGDGDITPEDMVRTDLPCNGDFRSAACIELLKRADIVVTNPPFSLFREYIAQLVEYDKKFVIIGNINAVTYKEFFPLLKEGKVWAGNAFNKTLQFGVPDTYFVKQDLGVDECGHRLTKVPAIVWFTNLDHPKRHQPIEIRGNKYYGNEDKYPKYANYDAIEVSKVADIPEDYVPCWFDCEHAKDCVYAHTEGLEDNALCEQACNGEMGVPVTYLDKHCEEQFEVLSESQFSGKPTEETIEYDIARGRKGGKGGAFYVHVDESRGGVASSPLQPTRYPKKCSGLMGVPITYLDKHCPEQFEIIGLDYDETMPTKVGLSVQFVKDYYKQGNTGCIHEGHPSLGYYRDDGTVIRTYRRIAIRRIKNAMG